MVEKAHIFFRMACSADFHKLFLEFVYVFLLLLARYLDRKNFSFKTTRYCHIS